ncbi:MULTISPECIES: phospholipase D-like domain-containing protein [unclassified Mycoplasma]|uniref:phospholipase D-like domain-containing protein n=1 Tax=unclassified Mycoplasma TaxID=2683645 RepID=UPI00211C9B95|nr:MULTISPECIES: phospholipase D-like domain-containing protein [unclassified Mycoplasma]UUM20067.1 phospholipase D-like domain-containing protein [Mycoplasma sp. 1578d]UUM25047.1 phospholipase D-like domain-containing protein [Mycoplasma sp. 3686d]
MFIIYTQRRPTGAKLSWIYFVLFFPIAGHLLFLVFGLIFKNKNERKIDKEAKFQISYYQENKIIKPLHRYPKELFHLEKLDNNFSLPGHIEFFDEGYHFYEKLFQSLREAKKSIYIVSYIIKSSEIFDQLEKIIIQKLKQKVKIKWILDDFGVTLFPKRRIKRLKSKGLEFQILGKIYYPLVNSNSFMRNHEKLFIIDSECVFTGGNNISDEYASLSKKYAHWVDINYKLTGPIINKYNLHFAKFWKIVSGKEIENLQDSLYQETNDISLYKNDIIQVSDSPNLNYSVVEYYWIKLISNAKKSIKIATPYFAISESLKTAIILALKSGVKVTIYFPGLPDNKWVHKISLSELSNLEEYGLVIKIYNHVFMHSKMGLVDEQIAWSGSTNMDNRSLYSQYENMDIFCGDAVKQISRIFDNYDYRSLDLSQSSEFNSKNNKFEKFIFDWLKPLI